MKITLPILSPIRFYNPNLAFDNNTHFQNPDNRVSMGYNWEGVNPIQYALPVPKQWPAGQPGIDFVVNIDSGLFYADLYDADDAYYKSLYVANWEPVGSDDQWRVWLDGVSGSGITAGFYTVKLFDNSDDSLLLESEPLYIADWFEDVIPFEFWNFENDFGVAWDNNVTRFTCRIMMPIRLFDPSPEFEKETYQDDPGNLTTLRTIIQRVFNFDSLPVSGHLAEQFQFAFACSELYLDRIHINSEEIPAAEPVEGTNLKTLNGKVTFVDFPGSFLREQNEVVMTDESVDWGNGTYDGMNITGNSVTIDDPAVQGWLYVMTGNQSYSNGAIVLVKIVITDNGTSDLPHASFDGARVGLNEWGTHWFSYRVNDDTGNTFKLWHHVAQKANYTAVITFYSI